MFPSLQKEVVKNFNNQFYIILVSPEHRDWMLRQITKKYKNSFGISIFLYKKRMQQAALV